MAVRSLDRRPSRTPRRSTGNTEHDEQARLMELLRWRLRPVYDHTAAVPNGGGRTKAEAGKLRAEGVRSGYPDILIDLPRGCFHGMRIEMKRANGRPSDVRGEQREWIERLTEAGYYCVVAFGCDRAFQEIQRYYELGEFNPSAPPPEAA